MTRAGGESPSTMRLLVLAHVFPRTLDDSMGAFLLHLADALADRGVETRVIAPHAAGLADAETLGSTRVQRFHYAPARAERLAYTGTMHETVGRGVRGKVLFAFFLAGFFFKALSAARSARPDIMQAHWWLPGGLIGALVSRLTRIPLVITTHGTDVEMLRRTRWAAPLARFAFARARSITCGSTYLRDQLCALGVTDAARVSVIPMPVNPLFENPPSPAAARQTSLVLAVARLTAQKSIDTLLDAFEILRGRGSPARLCIIGDGPERAALEERARALNPGAQVEFAGALPQAELPRHYAECAVFVLPSIREGMGLVLAEALLCGAPVIAANSGGVTDIVTDGETGLLVPERDAPALANAIEKLINDPASAARLASNGAAQVRERYTRARVAAQFLDVYEDARASSRDVKEAV